MLVEISCLPLEEEKTFGGMLLEIVMIVEDLTNQRAALVGVIKDLLEQHERQIDMEACALWQSYPDKFPEWNRAWENAAKILFEGED